MVAICVVCGKEFQAKRSTKKYCSDICYNIAKRKRKNLPNNGLKEKECIICGQKFIPKNAYASRRTCCYNCMPDGVQLHRGDFLAQIKKIRGGKCIRCGYDKCIKALEFHHINPKEKEFTISNDCFKLAEAIKESKKCILMCSNCHKEFHDGLWTLSELNLEEKEEVKP